MRQLEQSYHEHHANVTSKGQVTLPAEVRRLLGVRAHDKVIFTISGNQVRLVRAGSVVERTAGALSGGGPALSAEEERVAAEDAIAQESIECSGR